MGIAQSLYKSVQQFFNPVKVQPTASRKSLRSTSFSGEIKSQAKIIKGQDVKDWKMAVLSATNPKNPSRVKLMQLYESLLLDDDLETAIENRVYAVQRTKFTMLNKDGDEEKEAKELLERPWFRDVISKILWSVFTGTTLLEVYDLNHEMELAKVVEIPKEHFIPMKGIIVKKSTDSQGWDYRNVSYCDYYIQIGDDMDIGMLHKMAPNIIAKKFVKASWLDYIDKFGIPPRWVITDSTDLDRQRELGTMMEEMISNHWAVLQGDEKIEIGKLPGQDVFKVFLEFIKVSNSAIAKRVLGQDGTTQTDTTGTYGSLKVLQDVAEDRHEADRFFVRYIMNKEVIPRLIKLSPTYAVFEGCQFAWDITNEFDLSEIGDLIYKLSKYFKLDTDDLTTFFKERGINIDFDEKD